MNAPWALVQAELLAIRDQAERQARGPDTARRQIVEALRAETGRRAAAETAGAAAAAREVADAARLERAAAAAVAEARRIGVPAAVGDAELRRALAAGIPLEVFL